MLVNHSYDPNVFASLKDLLQAIRTVILESRENAAYSPNQTTTYLVPDLSLWWVGANPQNYPAMSEKPSVSYKALIEHVDRLVPGMPEYIKLHSTLARDHPLFTARLEGGIQFLIQACLADQFEETYESRAILWADELSGNPVDRRAKIFLPGILVKHGQTRISEKVMFRARCDSDFVNEVWQLGPQFPRLQVRFGCIVEYSSKTVYGGEFQNEIEALVRCLSLIELASVYPARYDLSTEALDWIGGRGSMNAGNGSDRFVYLFDDDAVPDFSASLEHLLGLVPSSVGNPYDPVALAYQRYRDAVCGAGSWQSVVFLAASCLEALFSSDIEELTRKLSFRAATLMRGDGFCGIEVRKLVRDAYSARSHYAHASSRKPKSSKLSPEENAKAIAPKILSVARHCLLRCAQLTKHLDREELERLLDEASLDERKQKYLRELLAKEWKPATRPDSPLYKLTPTPPTSAGL